jgi:hypothetical protein
MQNSPAYSHYSLRRILAPATARLRLTPSPRSIICWQVLASLVLTLCFAVNLEAADGVWKWVDKNGVTHYSDQPVPGAKRLDLNTVQTYDSEEASIARPEASPSAAPAKAAPRAPITYQAVEILKPLHDQSIIATGGQVQVSVRVDPGVQAGHQLRIEMDGKAVSPPDSVATALDLTEVPRGTHTLSATVVAANGDVLIKSETITFHVIQPSIRRK